MVLVERYEYKGRVSIVLKHHVDDRYPFAFGKAKARLIVEAFEEIKKFAEEAD